MVKKESNIEKTVAVEESPKEEKKSKLQAKVLIVTLFIILLLVAAAYSSFYFYSQYRKAQDLLKNPAKASQDEVKPLIDKIGKLIELPKDEVPTIATVSDKTKLAGQPFFAKAENGDKVLIYNKAQKAILYRPSANKIIEVSSINVNQPSPAASPSAQIQKQPKAVILNGTAQVGLTKTAETKLIDDKVALEILDRDNAKRNDYKGTLVIDITNKYKDLVSQIIKSLGGKASSLPQGEAAPKDAEIIIILGEDFNN